MAWTAGAASNRFLTINSKIVELDVSDSAIFAVSAAINGIGASGEPNGLPERTAQTRRISKIILDTP